jgi:phosphatidylglycerol:prolipoprotein diacylglycerol transferase
MPLFTWNIDPVFARIPKPIAVGVLAVVGLIMLINGLRRKQIDVVVVGLLMSAVGVLLWRNLGDYAELRYYSLIFVLVFLGGYSLLNWQIRRGGGAQDEAGDFIVYGVLAVLIGARLGHVIFYDLDKALQEPLWVLQIWTGGLASHGAVIGLIVAMYLYTSSRGVSFLEGSDRFAFSAALGATLVRVGNLFNSEIVGRPTDGTWGVLFPRYDAGYAITIPRHPSQVYEIALGLTVLGSLWLVDRLAGREKRPRGLLISTFFLVYFAGRFGTEFFKEYEGITPEQSALTMGQWLSLPCIALGLWGLVWSLKARIPAGWNVPTTASVDTSEMDSPASDSTRDSDVDDEFSADEETRRQRQAIDRGDVGDAENK